LESFVGVGWVGFGKTKMEVQMWSFASSHWEKEVLKVECPFGYPVSGSLSKSSQAGKLLNICLVHLLSSLLDFCFGLRFINVIDLLAGFLA